MDNYYSDYRVRASQSNRLQDIDKQRMEAKFEYIDTLYTLKIKFEVCPTCEGRGKHVNPSIDCNGLTREDFDQDPDFYDDYRSGVFDVECYGCKGENVIAVIDEQRCNPIFLSLYNDMLENEMEFRAIQESERRMGA